MMTDAAVKARNEYRREWRKKNPDKVKAMNDRYWAKKAAQAAAKQEQTPTGEAAQTKQ